MAEQDEVLTEFLEESFEGLDQLDRELLALERNPQQRDKLVVIFRTLHTIKGNSGFFGYARLGALAHAGESLLSRLRDGNLEFDAAIAAVLLQLIDALRAILLSIKQTGQETTGDDRQLLQQLAQAQQAPASLSQAQQSQTSTTSSPDALAVPEAAVEPGAGVSEGTIRVDVGLLDKLMNLVGELVLARNQVLQLTVQQQDAAFLNTSQRLNLITTELQEGVMKTRMQPIGTIWQRFPRIVRDLALTCGKQVALEMEGSETELDRTLIEAIRAPLTHIVRNAIDHGIETPDVRQARGKPAKGRLTLHAFHEGGQVNIEIADDGGGINTERVKQKALSRGLITAEQAARMSERELLGLIFMPGLSTAERVTNLSGRGVGMDVVKTSIEKIGGSVDLQSWPDAGTSIKLKIPLTLAIIPALIVTTGGDRYAIPQVSLIELVRLQGDQARSRIEHIHQTPVYRLRGQLLPLVYLHNELGVPTLTANDVTNIVVLQADNRQFGLVVEAINDTEEIVVKPLGRLLKGVSLFAGATIMGDGKVALILDVLRLAQGAGVVAEVRQRVVSEKASPVAETEVDRQRMLVFRLGARRRMALPLDQVARLEEVPASTIELAWPQEVIQYRGQIMPLIRLAQALGGSAEDQSDAQQLQVIVCSANGRCVGLVVDQILDIVDAPITVRQGSRCAGVLGSTVIQSRVTELLDVPGVLCLAGAELGSERAGVEGGRA